MADVQDLVGAAAQAVEEALRDDLAIDRGPGHGVVMGSDIGGEVVAAGLQAAGAVPVDMGAQNGLAQAA